MNQVKILLLLVISICLSACQKAVFSEFAELPVLGWHQDSVITFEYDIPSVESGYEMQICIRHTDRYPYQNMWLFVQQDSLPEDTIEFYLADDRGHWLGNGVAGYIEMPVLYEADYHFQQPGKHCLRVRQGMREGKLRGVMNVGLKIK